MAKLIPRRFVRPWLFWVVCYPVFLLFRQFDTLTLAKYDVQDELDKYDWDA